MSIEPKSWLQPKPPADQDTRKKAEGFYREMEERVRRTPGARGSADAKQADKGKV